MQTPLPGQRAHDVGAAVARRSRRLQRRLSHAIHARSNFGNRHGNPFRIVQATQGYREPECELSVMVNLDLSPTWIWEFSFRTHRSDQALFSLHTANSDVTRIRLERDFFLRVDTGKPIPLCQLSDGLWHTVAILSEDGDVSLIVDNFEKIPLTELQAHESRLSAVEIELDGEILLIDPTDVAENSYRLLRDSDRLSFFYIPVSAESQHLKPIIRLGLTYKSESDIGLLLFGFWQEEETKGRFQVHYRDRQLIGIYCENQGEEVCKGCSISRIEGFGNDQWTRVAFFESYGGVSLVADKSVCVLSELGSQNNISLAEVYSIPVLATGSAVFIGGTFYEKKKSGLYLPSFEHKYFENTREKVPSLRGCLKDVFVDGKSVDLSSIHSQQMEHTLVNAGDDSAYAIQFMARETYMDWFAAQQTVVRMLLPVRITRTSSVCQLGDLLVGADDSVVPAAHSSDRDRILRDSPDYSVKLRSNKTESESSYDGDGSIGTDDTDLNAYRDIPSHRVKIYRESMVSILVPGMDQPSEAIVKRVPSTERVASTPLLPPSPAPLVRAEVERECELFDDVVIR
ncbi:hypothetical protein ANCCEY_14702 [Ancylostoma ceylanicum]|uniref:Laminin G domain-containing protein n=1 Tax=Ancylostoma ceylanicum TaxID=53326 RepID=A0A0D6L619_9BILA|nr:hypothetical protein ANCCEY_14702 [Ancylostoma ceylanicum]